MDNFGLLESKIDEKTRTKVMAEAFIIEYVNNGKITVVSPEIEDTAKIMLQHSLNSDVEDIKVLLDCFVSSQRNVGLDEILSRKKVKE